ncbi:fungal-specific transcription factor domain-containing protein [Hypoxylon cercidicola]|nr:fungal-specific transcription factor domain-containing protein [Hypoxylon cercidicola]
MFTTFSAQMMSPVTTPGSRGSGSMTPSEIGKAKRRKVTRACDSCRLNRVRCDNEQPCRNCRSRSEKCTNSMPWEAHSLPAAKREIERLQERLRELEEKQASKSPPAERTGDTASDTSQLSPRDPAIEESFNWSGRRRSANDVLTSTNEAAGGRMSEERERSESNIYYTSPSAFCAIPPFIHRMRKYLERASGQPYPISRLEPTGPHLELASLENRNGSRSEFTRAEERHLLSLFWQRFHFLYPILDQDEMQNHHDSLWNNASLAGSPSSRMPSALMDILLALSMQFSSSFLVRDGSNNTRRSANSRAVNAGLAGQWFYNRCHRLLLEEQQNPTLRSVQSSILSAVYILNAGSLNLANTSLATSVRMAQILGLHEDLTSLELNAKQGELRRNIWRALIQLDGYLAVTMGLPPLISQPSLTYSLSVDLWQSGNAVFTSNDGNNQNDIWASFQVYHTKLILAAQSVHALFCSKQMELQRSDLADHDTRPITLETVAGYIAPKMKAIRECVDNVPSVLTISRKGNGGKPFSFADGPTLNLDPHVPLWLQRQRLIFEVTYHHLNLLILRPFVRFDYHGSPMAQADTHGVVGLKHAITLSHIVNQAFTEGDALTGWHFVFRCQWDATLYLLGFILASPTSPLITDAQRSLTTALHTFSILEKYLSTARSAQDIVHDILGRISTLVNGDGLSPSNQLLPPNRADSMGSFAYSSSPPIGVVVGSPASTNSEYYPINPELTAHSPSYPLWNSGLQTPFHGPSGVNPDVGPGLSQVGNQQPNIAYSSPSNEEFHGVSFNPDMEGVLDNSHSMLLNSDWQPFTGFQPGLE